MTATTTRAEGSAAVTDQDAERPTGPERPASGGTMPAVVQERYGVNATEVLQVGQVDVPTPSDDEVLVRVAAAGLDRGVWHLMAGRPYLVRAAFGLRAPKASVPGMDLAGTVVAVGAEVDRFEPGDDVLGIGSGTFATHAVAKAEKLVHKPAGLSFELAAALPISGLTALQAVRDQAEVQPGERVLILGASGGVGSYTVQVAKSVGAEVTGVGGTSSQDHLRELGCDHVADYRRDDLTDLPPHDVVIDIGGNRSLRELRRLLTERGRLVIDGGEEGGRWVGGIDRNLRASLWSPFVGQQLKWFVSPEKAEDLADLLDLVESGEVTPSIDRTVALAGAPAAVQALYEGRIRGKAVVVP